MPDDVHRGALIEYLIVTDAVVFAKETECDTGITNTEIAECNLRQPLGQVRVKKERIEGRVGIETKQRLQEAEHRRS